MRTAFAVMIFAFLAAWAEPALAADRAFYDATPAEIRGGPPGSIIRIESWDMHTVYKIRAWRILYRSTGLDGQPIAVSGTVIVPTFPPPPGGRPIVAWAHPTTGVARKCAPSLHDSILGHIAGFTDMVPLGYAIVATDYPGLGTPGPHPYLVGPSEGRALLDSVRAVRGMEAAQTRNEYVLWGYSQGGHAVLWAGDLARRYAPELKLAGVAAAAPPTALGTLFEDDERETAGKILASMALQSWSQVFGIPLASVLAPQAIPTVGRIAAHCVDTLGGDLDVLDAESPLDRTFLIADPVSTPPWDKLMRENSLSAINIGVPMFVSQGLDDSIVRPTTTRSFIEALCARGESVTSMLVPNTGHDEIAHKSANAAIGWIDQRFRGVPSTGCRRD